MTNDYQRFTVKIGCRDHIHDNWDGRDYYMDNSRDVLELCVKLNELRDSNVELWEENKVLRDGRKYKELKSEYEDLKDRYDNLEYKFNSIKRMAEKGY